MGVEYTHPGKWRACVCTAANKQTENVSNKGRTEFMHLRDNGTPRTLLEVFHKCFLWCRFS